MKSRRNAWQTLILAFLGVVTFVTTITFAQQASPQMSFFITSVGSGKGANLGGLAGADQHCTALAKAVGVGNKTWHAYLSTQQPVVNARDRIGRGPWYNSKGVMIAKNVDDLHSDSNNLTKETQLNEKGMVVNGRSDNPNTHDILTGSSLDGRAVTGGDDTSCANFTSEGAGSAMVGHHDRGGGGANPSSWNSAHPSKGCSQANLVATGGNGYYYCFATN